MENKYTKGIFREKCNEVVLKAEFFTEKGNEAQ
jgi:hypothetical protein